MTEIIGFDIIRSENILINGTKYTIRFITRKDGQEHKLLVSNDLNDKQASYGFTEEVAQDFRHYHDEELCNKVADIIKDDAESGRI